MPIPLKAMRPRLQVVRLSAAEERASAAAAPRIPNPHPGGRRFFRAPQSIAASAAAVLEPAIHVGMLYLAHRVNDLPFDRMSIWLSLLIIALTFPGTDRFRDQPLVSLADIARNWLWLLTILAMCGYVTASFADFDAQAIQEWAIATPFAQWSAVLAGRALQRSHAAGTVRRAVVVGGGPLGTHAASSLAGRRETPIEVVGYFDDRQGERLHAIALGQRLGRLDEVARYVDKLGIPEVYITLPMGSQTRIVRLLESLQQTTASIFFVPDVFSISIVQGRMQDVNGLPVVGICETPFTGINAFVKRVSDLVLSVAILGLTAPLLAAIAFGIKLDSRGPVLFKQRRNGLDGEEIIVWKFRTMHTAENDRGIRQVTRHDARVTRLGAVLRRTSLDELPQFFNVVQGRMSIVGPRPHAVAHNEQYRQLIDGYMVRHKARPGVTGWAQVNGYRGETDTLEKMQGRVECDLEYLRNWSLALDFSIIARTLRLVFFDRQAY
jgi:putative colanic acid biosysnthesis UDP-glucose lipid carrier transferase